MADLGEYTLSTGDVARQLGVSLQSVSRWANEGKLPCVKRPGQGWRMFRPADIEVFAADLFRNVDGAA